MWVSWFGCRMKLDSLEKARISEPGPPECSSPRWFRTSPDMTMVSLTGVAEGLVKPMLKVRLGAEKDRQDIWILLAISWALE